MIDIERTMRINGLIFRDHYLPHINQARGLIDRAEAAGISANWKAIGDNINTYFDRSDRTIHIRQNYGTLNDKIRIRWKAFKRQIDYYFDHYNRRFEEPFIDDSIHIHAGGGNLVAERIQRRVSRKDRTANGAFYDRMVAIGADFHACDTLFNSVAASSPATRAHKLFPWLDTNEWRRWDQEPSYAEFLAPDEMLIFVGDGTPMISRKGSGYLTNYHAVPGWLRDLVRPPVH
ncbi:hypothetical protein [Mesorhizobium sp.]|uniref:hypothetical protein n=1 Tax=Mesorhizobium sp. TaxID=1871066 RepID=UPI000FD49CD2|nr:hypothetical protein [Mesorhizobium sp.]RVC56030.1 hypothetical protein EN779_25635 [Mesorhizobium sp. M4B.F.Ca.ET.088.02.2.1]RWF32441.1 MAG: hypothetical protein EOS45_06910 [Mesorhizobium sp.]